MDEPPSNNAVVNTFLLGVSYPIFFGCVALLVSISALISISEIAFFSLQDEDIERCKNGKSKIDYTISALMEKPRVLLASMILINTFVKVAIIVMAAFIMLIIDTSVSAIIITIILTTLMLVLLGEFIPKVYAEQKKMALARSLAGIWYVIVRILSPLLIPLLNLKNAWGQRFVKERTTADELSQVLELASGDKETSEGEKEILRGIVNFGTLTVKQVMRTRDEISSININSNFEELMTYVNVSGFSRIPVFRNTIDAIEGVLYIKDLLPYLEHPLEYQWQELLRPGLFVPETKKIDLLLKDFQEKRVHMAIVLNEHHQTVGVVTLEDLIEEIIGEINDEFDEVDHPYKKIDDRTFVFDGRTTFQDFCKAVEIDSGTIKKQFDERESLEKILLELNDELPHAGDQINFEKFTFVIESIVGKKIKRVRVKVHEEV